VPLSRNLGTLTSWNPLGHSRPVMGLMMLAHTVNGLQPVRSDRALNCELREQNGANFALLNCKVSVFNVARVEISPIHFWYSG